MKLFLLQQEHNDDGEIFFDTIPCATFGLAKRIMDEKVAKLVKDNPKYQGLDINNPSDEFEVDKDILSININLPYDDYYEYYYIEETELIEK